MLLVLAAAVVQVVLVEMRVKDVIVLFQQQMQDLGTEVVRDQTELPGRMVVLFHNPSKREAAQQSLAADGAIACFSSNLVPSGRMLIARRS